MHYCINFLAYYSNLLAYCSNLLAHCCNLLAYFSFKALVVNFARDIIYHKMKQIVTKIEIKLLIDNVTFKTIK